MHLTNRLGGVFPHPDGRHSLTLEEIFIYELGGEDCAVKDILA